MASVPRVRIRRRTSETHYNIINMEFIKEENEEMGVKDEETEEKIGWFLFSLHRFYTEKCIILFKMIVVIYTDIR